MGDKDKDKKPAYVMCEQVANDIYREEVRKALAKSSQAEKQEALRKAEGELRENLEACEILER